MQFVGVDLAWGPNNRTGLAALDASGRLIESGAVNSDDEILNFLQRNLPDEGVVAVDAPLVVPNDTGQRIAETSIGRTFGAYGASAHTANRANPYFRPPRAAVLAERANLDIDPANYAVERHRSCIEVYPHPAMVAVFGLTHIIPYKQKSGRDFLSLYEANGRLLDLIDQYCGVVLHLDESARWMEIRHRAKGAGTKSALKSIEDEIDAIFCAYLAWMWGTCKDKMQVHGDVTTGYIVAPRMVPQGSAPIISTRAVSAESKRQKLSTLIRSQVPQLTDTEVEGLVSAILPLIR